MRATTLWIAMAGLGLAACVSPSDPWEHREALVQSQRRYTEAIRWGDLEKASRYVDPELREAFLALSSTFETVRITDYEIGEPDLEPEKLARAEVDVTYHGFVMPHYIERRVTEQQVWYRDEGMGNEWRVRPELAAILDGMGARR
jgi:hypothetical protein